ncbi:hypothetical protein KW469_07340 [Vibrio fluvialis]|nr:hypothetical protein [Vibrio fluvialis]
MVDISAISMGLTSIKTALDITKDLRNADLSVKDAELKLKLADLIEALSDAKIQMSEIKDENQSLRDTIKEYERKLALKAEVIFENGHCFLKSPESGQAPGPFCANCYSDSQKLILVSELPLDLHDIGKYRCPKCDAITQ